MSKSLMGYKYRKFFSFEGKRYSVYGNTLDEVYAKKAAKLQEKRKEMLEKLDVYW